MWSHILLIELSNSLILQLCIMTHCFHTGHTKNSVVPYFVYRAIKLPHLQLCIMAHCLHTGHKKAKLVLSYILLIELSNSLILQLCIMAHYLHIGHKKDRRCPIFCLLRYQTPSFYSYALWHIVFIQAIIKTVLSHILLIELLNSLILQVCIMANFFIQAI